MRRLVHAQHHCTQPGAHLHAHTHLGIAPQGGQISRGLRLGALIAAHDAAWSSGRGTAAVASDGTAAATAQRQLGLQFVRQQCVVPEVVGVTLARACLGFAAGLRPAERERRGECS